MDLQALMNFLKENGIVVNVLFVKLAGHFVVVLLSHTAAKIYLRKRFSPISKFFAAVTISTAFVAILAELLPVGRNWFILSFFIGLMTDVLPERLLRFLNNTKTVDAVIENASNEVAKKYKGASDFVKAVLPNTKNQDTGAVFKQDIEDKKEAPENKEDTKKEEVATSDEQQPNEIEQRIKREHRFKRH